jgi:hypothetical protein
MITRPDYEHYIYSLPDRYSSIVTSSLVVIPTGPLSGKVSGEIEFTQQVRLQVREVVDFSEGKIVWYSYEVRRTGEVLYYPDSQGHPLDESLKATHPHHKHIHPDIKHHRVPAEGLSFDHPNLDLIIQEIERDALS